MSSRLTNFVVHVSDLYSDRQTDHIKTVIGDSTLNNRVVSVNQFIRYLLVTGRPNTASTVRRVYDLLTKRLRNSRVRRNQRTDAYDMNEFLLTLSRSASEGAVSTRHTLSKVIPTTFN